MEHITLYFRQGSSDKVYQTGIESKGDGFIVAFAYGRRGATLQTGTKTQSPVKYDEAKRIYDKIVAEKAAKGYTPGADGTPYQQTENAERATGIHCQLLNSIKEEDCVESLIADPAYWMQEKFDGRRLLLRKESEIITGINRLGLAIALPNSLVQFAAECPVDFIVDGEAIGDTLHAFDALLIGGEEITGLRYGERYLRLTNLLASFRHECVHLVDTAFVLKQKRELFAQCKQRGAEGIVFKYIDAPYVAGRPASGGSQLKYKFVETASFIVGKVNAKRSVGLLLFDGDKLKSAGNVTIPPNHQEIPQTGQIVECKYLYAFPKSGCIYQPAYVGRREDIKAEECTTTQLKYKAEAEEAA
jgi:bifunctional non-homologous end joining protein LigD